VVTPGVTLVRIHQALHPVPDVHNVIHRLIPLTIHNARVVRSRA
jgi:hypothetical protein